jgi:hypothetical protein
METSDRASISDKDGEIAAIPTMGDVERSIAPDGNIVMTGRSTPVGIGLPAMRAVRGLSGRDGCQEAVPSIRIFLPLIFLPED